MYETTSFVLQVPTLFSFSFCQEQYWEKDKYGKLAELYRDGEDEKPLSSRSFNIDLI